MFLGRVRTTASVGAACGVRDSGPGWGLGPPDQWTPCDPQTLKEKSPVWVRGHDGRGCHTTWHDQRTRHQRFFQAQPGFQEGRAALFWLQRGRSQRPGGRAMYSKLFNPGVEMGAEVFLHWGSATPHSPWPLGSREGLVLSLLGARQGRTEDLRSPAQPALLSSHHGHSGELAFRAGLEALSHPCCVTPVTPCSLPQHPQGVRHQGP